MTIGRLRFRTKRKKPKTQPPPESAGGFAEQLPPASFPILVSTLASQALAGLGALPDPLENKPVVRLEIAKHMIDTLAVLEEKTKGNLSSDEAEMLTSTLHQLRLAYISVQSSPRSAGNAAAGTSQIELP